MEINQITFNPFQENTFILWDETKECIIIDPGCYEKNEKEYLSNFIESNNLKPVKLINTHCHIDHILGNKFVSEKWKIDLYMNKKDLPLLEGAGDIAKMYGFENDQEMFNYSIKNLNKNAKIEYKDINLINYNNLDADCYIINTPFWNDTMLKNLIDKIFLSRVSSKGKYYIIIINIDVILKKIQLNTIFTNFKLTKFINAGPIRSLRIYKSLENR